jgi:hypothetical protein
MKPGLINACHPTSPNPQILRHPGKIVLYSKIRQVKNHVNTLRVKYQSPRPHESMTPSNVSSAGFLNTRETPQARQTSVMILPETNGFVHGRIRRQHGHCWETSTPHGRVPLCDQMYRRSIHRPWLIDMMITFPWAPKPASSERLAFNAVSKAYRVKKYFSVSFARKKLARNGWKFFVVNPIVARKMPLRKD